VASTIVVKIVGETAGLEGATARAELSLASLGKAVAKTAGLFIGAYGLEEALKASEEKLQQQEVVAAQTATALKSTGEAAGVTASQVHDLAEALSAKDHIDAEQIQSTENLLLRYTNIRNVVGEGNDVFTRATQVALDFSAATGRSASTAAQMLGKALQDPITGLGALRRAGVIFTAEQKDQIKALEESGDMMGAQKLMLSQLEERYTGTAQAVGQTFGKQLAYAKYQGELLGASILQTVLPALSRFTGDMSKWIEEARTSQALHDDLRKGLHDLGDAFDAVRDAIVKINNKIDGLHSVVVGAKTVFEAISDALRNKFVRAIAIAEAAYVAFVVILSSNPFLAIVTASLLAIGEIRTHWTELKGWFEAIWKDIQLSADIAWKAIEIGALATLKAIIEPWSHLPWKAGEWARDLKSHWTDNIGAFKQQISDDAAAITAVWSKAGTLAGIDFTANLSSAYEQGIASGALAGPSVGGAVPVASASGATGTVLATAQRLGVGSGAVYGTGGGHGGSVVPGTALDCSGYVYQCFLAAGFEGFPGTSELMWATHSGPNWTSQVIDASECQPGDVVFMVGDTKLYASPGHVGIIVSGSGSGAMMEQYYASHMPADVVPLSSIGDVVGIKRFYLGKQDSRGTANVATAPATASPSTTPPASGLGATAAKAGKTASASQFTIPINYTLAIDKAALTKSTTDDLKAVDDEIAYLQKQLKSKKLTPEKTDQAVQDLKSAEDQRTSMLKAAHDAQNAAVKAALDKQRAIVKQADAELAADKQAAQTREKNALSKHLTQLHDYVTQMRDRMSAEAKSQNTREETELQNHLTKLQNIVKSRQSAFEQAFSTVAQKALEAFDRETAKGLAALQSQYAAPTPEEQALAAFQAQRQAEQEASQRADIYAQLGATTDPAEIASLNEQLRQLDLDDTERDLEQKAEASRTARDKDEQDAEQSYQDDRANKRDALQGWLDDQEKKLEDGTTQWDTFWAGLKTKAVANGTDTGSAFWSAYVAAGGTANQDLGSLNTAKSDAKDAASALATLQNLKPATYGTTTVSGGSTYYQSGSGVEGKKPLPMAVGGIVTHPTLAIVGEAGPEAVVPLKSGLGASVTVNVHGSVITERQLTDVVRRALLEVKRANGSTGL